MSNLPNRTIYCLKCRRNTITTDVQLHEKNRPKGAPGRQYILKGTCTVCKRGVAQFVSCKKSQIFHGATGGNLNSILNSGKLPELHLPGHNFTGPGTKFKKRLLRGDVPVKELDKAAQFHDITYSIFKDTKYRHVFDKKLQDEAFNIVKDSNHSLKDRTEAGLVGGVMLTRQKR